MILCLWDVAEEGQKHEGRHHGRRRGNAAAAPHVEPAEADGADRRQAVYGAHHRAAAPARVRRGDRDTRVSAPGDRVVLRGRRVDRRLDRLLPGGDAHGNRGVGAARRAAYRRAVPRHLGRRPHRLRPLEPRSLPHRERRRRHDCAEGRRQPARLRHRRHGGRRPHRAVSREADVGPGLLRHDQHGHLRARPVGGAPHSRRHAVRLLEGALPAAARARPPALRTRLRGLLAGHRQSRAVPAGELRRPRRADRARHPWHPPAGKHLDRRGRGDRRPRRRRGAGVHRQQLRRIARGDDRSALGARCERAPPRAARAS